MNGSRLAIGEKVSRRRRPLATRRRRVSRQRWVLGGLLATALLAGLIGAGRWLTGAAIFRVTRVESGPYRYTAPAALEDILATVLDGNIWSLAAGALADTLTALPWVAEVRVGRQLPGTVKVHLREWQPLLTVVSSGGGDQADSDDLVLLQDGRVVSVPEHLYTPNLPVLGGVRLAHQSDQSWRLPAGREGALLDLLGAISQTGLESVSPVDFILAVEDGFALVLQGHQGRLLIGGDEFVPKLEGFLAARGQLDTDSEVDLRFRNRIATRPSQPPVVPGEET